MRRLGLFGSVARGVSGPDSDLDFVVEFDAKSFDRYMDLKLLLERLFGCTVDLVLSDAIKPRLKHVILGEAVYAQGLSGSTSKTSWSRSGGSAACAAGISKEAFRRDPRTADAVVRNLEVIGEAVKRLPPDLRERRPSVEWSKMSGLRDVLIHAYFGVDLDIVWDIVESKLDAVAAAVASLLDEERPAAMTLSSGSRLGPYEILSPLGAGGMGRCTGPGTRGLGDVAIKVLPEELSSETGG